MSLAVSALLIFAGWSPAQQGAVKIRLPCEAWQFQALSAPMSVGDRNLSGRTFLRSFDAFELRFGRVMDYMMAGTGVGILLYEAFFNGKTQGYLGFFIAVSIFSLGMARSLDYLIQLKIRLWAIVGRREEEAIKAVSDLKQEIADSGDYHKQRVDNIMMGLVLSVLHPKPFVYNRFMELIVELTVELGKIQVVTFPIIHRKEIPRTVSRSAFKRLIYTLVLPWKPKDPEWIHKRYDGVWRAHPLPSGMAQPTSEMQQRGMTVVRQIVRGMIDQGLGQQAHREIQEIYGDVARETPQLLAGEIGEFFTDLLRYFGDEKEEINVLSELLRRWKYPDEILSLHDYEILAKMSHQERIHFLGERAPHWTPSDMTEFLCKLAAIPQLGGPAETVQTLASAPAASPSDATTPPELQTDPTTEAKGRRFEPQPRISLGTYTTTEGGSIDILEFEWRGEDGGDLWATVNLRKKHVRGASEIKMPRETLLKHGVPPERLGQALHDLSSHLTGKPEDIEKRRQRMRQLAIQLILGEQTSAGLVNFNQPEEGLIIRVLPVGPQWDKVVIGIWGMYQKTSRSRAIEWTEVITPNANGQMIHLSYKAGLKPSQRGPENFIPLLDRIDTQLSIGKAQQISAQPGDSVYLEPDDVIAAHHFVDSGSPWDSLPTAAKSLGVDVQEVLRTLKVLGFQPPKNPSVGRKKRLNASPVATLLAIIMSLMTVHSSGPSLFLRHSA